MFCLSVSRQHYQATRCSNATILPRTGAMSRVYTRPRMVCVSGVEVHEGRRWPSGQRTDVMILRTRVQVPPQDADNFNHRRVAKDYLHAIHIFNQPLPQRLSSRVAPGANTGQASHTSQHPLKTKFARDTNGSGPSTAMGGRRDLDERYGI